MIPSEFVLNGMRLSPSPPYLFMWTVPLLQSPIRRQCQIMDQRRQRYTMLFVPRLLEDPPSWAWLYLYIFLYPRRVGLNTPFSGNLMTLPFSLRNAAFRIHTCAPIHHSHDRSQDSVFRHKRQWNTKSILGCDSRPK